MNHVSTRPRVELIRAPAFWGLLPLAAIAFLISQTVTDLTNSGWSIIMSGESRDTPPGGVSPRVWIGVGAWLLVAAGLLLFRLSLLRYSHVENERNFEHGVAHSIHRSSAGCDDDEERPATSIALDHRLDDRHAARLHAAFAAWLARAGQPHSGSKPASSQMLFFTQATSGNWSAIIRSPPSPVRPPRMSGCSSPRPARALSAVARSTSRSSRHRRN